MKEWCQEEEVKPEKPDDANGIKCIDLTAKPSYQIRANEHPAGEHRHDEPVMNLISRNDESHKYDATDVERNEDIGASTSLDGPRYGRQGMGTELGFSNLHHGRTMSWIKCRHLPID